MAMDDVILTPAEIVIFEAARRAGHTLRKSSFEDWTLVGEAVVIARTYGNRAVGRKERTNVFRSILSTQGLGWLTERSSVPCLVHLEQMMSRLEEVLKWRAGLSEQERTAWASPQSVYLRFLSNNPRARNGPFKAHKGPTAQPMTVSELLSMRSEEAAQCLLDRNRSKAHAIFRALGELIENTARPISRPRTAPLNVERRIVAL
jgi:hypothetical protein